eukprot:scaffold87790_cov19-Tisochrysis_lutea.AAC.4
MGSSIICLAKEEQAICLAGPPSADHTHILQKAPQSAAAIQTWMHRRRKLFTRQYVTFQLIAHIH